jgi:hypothetical protein
VTSPVCGALVDGIGTMGGGSITHRLYAPGERPGGPPLTLYLRTGRILHIRARRVLLTMTLTIGHVAAAAAVNVQISRSVS